MVKGMKSRERRRARKMDGWDSRIKKAEGRGIRG